MDLTTLWEQRASDLVLMNALVSINGLAVLLSFFILYRVAVTIRKQKTYFTLSKLSMIGFLTLLGYAVVSSLAAFFSSWFEIHPVLWLALNTAFVLILGLLAFSFSKAWVRKQMNRELSHHEKKQRSQPLMETQLEILMSGKTVGFFEWRDIGNLRGRLFSSPDLDRSLGFQLESTAPNFEAFLNLVHLDQREDLRNLFLSPWTEEKKELSYRLRIFSQYRWVRSVFKVCAGGIGPSFVLGTIEDIHEQKIAHDRVQEAQLSLEEEIKKRTLQLERANQAKTRFLANISHELRTPLGLVLGFSELLTSKKTLDPESKEYVSKISKNGEILSRVINDLLDLSKIEAGKMRFQFSRVKLKTLIKDLESAFGEKGKEKQVTMIFQNYCSEDEVVVTDEIRLKQIIYNLLSNALKYTDKGKIHLSLSKKDKVCFVDVVDTGAGIPESEQDAIFDEYTRGEVSDSVGPMGTGLGLLLARNLAKALGGEVELISSQVGKGSHFRMSFLSDEAKLQAQTQRKQDVQLEKELANFEIFVLDDNEDNIRLVEIFLQRLGCRVRGFTTPKSLFAEILSNAPDLILLDIHMPEMNGFEVFTHLRKSGYKSPIWALTAYSLNEDIQKILEYGFDDYIRKPVSIDSMKRKLAFELQERIHD